MTRLQESSIHLAHAQLLLSVYIVFLFIFHVHVWKNFCVFFLPMRQNYALTLILAIALYIVYADNKGNMAEPSSVIQFFDFDVLVFNSGCSINSILWGFPMQRARHGFPHAACSSLRNNAILTLIQCHDI